MAGPAGSGQDAPRTGLRGEGVPWGSSLDIGGAGWLRTAGSGCLPSLPLSVPGAGRCFWGVTHRLSRQQVIQLHIGSYSLGNK